jgi:hypothetical protein
MTELINTINEIVQFGLQPNLLISDKNEVIEKNLVKIYSLSFDIKYDSDNKDYKEVDFNYYDIRKNVESNFPNFGFYNEVLDINDFVNEKNIGLGDAIDDLTDIIKDFLEVKWRIENNSLDDGLYHFLSIFRFHSKQHILDLLNYLNQIEH